MSDKQVIIIGAGPTGLTAAYELLQQSDIRPVVYEMSDAIGGISQTVEYKGNRMDIGGHRFFSRSNRVMRWWLDILPLQSETTHNYSSALWDAVQGWPDGPDPALVDNVMLMRTRLSRILFKRRLFDYPLSLSTRTLANLGWKQTAEIGLSYALAQLKPIRSERSLEDFLINRFGRSLYRTFFADYTEKVWGVPCAAISPEWGAQRIKALSVKNAVLDALRNCFRKDVSLEQSRTETSLIRQFLYPKLGPGQLWEEVAARVRQGGGEVRLRHKVVGLRVEGSHVVAVQVRNEDTGQVLTHDADYVLSTMPVQELVAAVTPEAPSQIQSIAQGLIYRDFITVGPLLERLQPLGHGRASTDAGTIADNWIYVQESDVKVGRLQFFNNWSPYLVRDPRLLWIGLEYFCNIGDTLWSRSNAEMLQFATEELERLGMIDKQAVLDGTVVRMPRCYPAYFGTYDRFPTLREYTDRLANLFLVGRNGMHRYNNQDHSMLTAMAAVENIRAGRTTKDNVWAVNVEQQYHEEQKTISHDTHTRPSAWSGDEARHESAAVESSGRR